MIAVEISTPGGPDVLVPVERPRPSPQTGEVLIQVEAAGVNRPDVSQRLGKYPPPPGASDIPGLEVAGTIVEVGAGVEEFRVGDAVCALVSGGGYAEFCTAPWPQCLPLPRGKTPTEAAAIPETFFTVWTNVFDRGRLRANESILIHGGSGGIGTTAIQLARARGSRVFTTAGSDEKCRICEQLGAERAINHKTDDFVAVVRDCTSGRGVDVVLDIIGAYYFTRNLEVLAIDGRLVMIGTQRGATTELNIQTVMRRRLTITGSTLRARTVAEKGKVAAAVRREVWPLIESGAVEPLIHRTFPLNDAAAAHRLMDSGEHVGKIVLLP